MKLSKSCKYDIMILSLPSFVECRKIPVLSPGLTQLRKRNGRGRGGGGGGGELISGIKNRFETSHGSVDQNTFLS